MHLGINLFWILGSLSTYRLFHSYESKKVSGRFPDDALPDFSAAVVRGPNLSTRASGGMPWLFRVVRWCLTMPYQILIGPEATTECDDGKRVSTFYPSEWWDE